MGAVSPIGWTWVLGAGLCLALALSVAWRVRRHEIASPALLFALRLAEDWRNLLGWAAERTLDWLDRRVGRAWSGRAFDRCLQTALLAPVAGLFVTWGLSGDAGMLGGTVGILRHAAPSLRLAAVVAALGGGLALRRAAVAAPRRAWLWALAAVLLVGGCGDLIASMDPGSLAGRHVDDGSYVGAACLGALAVLGAGFSGARVFALAMLCMAAVAVNENAPAVDVVFVAPALMLAGMAERAEEQGRLGRFWRVAWPVLVLAAAAVLAVQTWLGTPVKGRVALAFLVLAPLLAAPLVWLGWDGARTLLRRRLRVPAADGLGWPVLLAGMAGTAPLAAMAFAGGLNCLGPSGSIWARAVCRVPPWPWPAAVWSLVLLPLLPVAAMLAAAAGSLSVSLVPSRTRELLRLRVRHAAGAPVVPWWLAAVAGLAAGLAGAVLLVGLAVARSVLAGWL